MCWPQAYSTMLGVHGKESGYSTKENEGIDSVVDVGLRVSEKTWNGDGNPGSDRNVVERRQPKLTEKFKAYRLNERKKERNKLKREIQSRIANIGTLMGLDKNLELVGEESVKLNECFKEFGDLHEEIQELLTEEEQIPDTQVYDNLHTEVRLVRETVQKWMTDAGRRINEERKSTKSSAKTRSSKLHMHQAIPQEQGLSKLRQSRQNWKRGSLNWTMLKLRGKKQKGQG